jgi:quercetin dioxygenase-like cupin family protein
MLHHRREATMPFVDERDVPEVMTRPGIYARTIADQKLGATGATVMMVRAAPDARVPLHVHRVEETVVMFEGRIWIEIDKEHRVVGPGETVIIPPEAPHCWGTEGRENVKMMRIYSGLEPFAGSTYLAGGPPNLKA